MLYNIAVINIMEVRYVTLSRIGNAPKPYSHNCLQWQAQEVWSAYEEAKAYFLELMMTTEGEERDRAECIYIQLTHGLSECSDEDK